MSSLSNPFPIDVFPYQIFIFVSKEDV